ncbi:exosortase H-associated membrane protein [Acidovorax sp. Leaf160]|uniref:exosortase H-associated membrane protein n=1 Tax=Acidovorax sp. Leaf160 TaxID=1736280 RepID=UPI0006FF3EEC|nr:exosortase H-associated membrane protein [Acidovorax sp. Leaf160]KQR63047.1 hypothetical protein ASF94_00410 [Acidovorax sp. Leaf160]
MRRPSVLVTFALSAFVGVLALTLLWTKVSPWTSYPVAAISHMVLERVTPMWVRTVRIAPGRIEVDTTVEVPVEQAGGRRAEVTLDADPGRYAYGLPIFLALLVAARVSAKAGGRLRRAVMGYLLLLPAQAASLVMFLLMQLALTARMDMAALRVVGWELNVIVYGYQLGVLVLPTLMPVLVWLWLDRQFFSTVIVQGWKDSMARR